MRLFRLLLLLLALAGPLPAAAASGVQVTLTRAEGGEWLLDYAFDRDSPVWFFPRSNPDLAGNPWRPQSWTVETPGVRLERIGAFDALTSDGERLRRVRIRVRPFSDPLSADYSPALQFSDGGIAFFGGHFLVIPMASRGAVEALPQDINGVSLPGAPITLTMRDPGHTLLVRGRSSRDRARMRIEGTDAYVYSGHTNIGEGAALTGVIDPGLPQWIRGELDVFIPRLLGFYTDRFGRPAGGRPVALIAWQGADRARWSLGGSVLEGTIVMQMSGAYAVEPKPDVRARLLWFFAHESSHFWLGQTVRYLRQGESWTMEGSADLIAARTLQQLSPDYDVLGALQEELDECLTLVGPGEALAGAAARNAFRAYYSCGAMLHLAAEGASGDIFGFVRALIDANRADGFVTTEDWLAQFQAATGDAALTDAVRTFVEQGVPDPRAFWTRLFTATGVKFTASPSALTLQ